MEWKAVPGWPNYEVSCQGVVRNSLTHKAIRPRVRRAGRVYLAVDLYDKSERSTVDVHIIVCLAFHGPRPTPEHEAAHGNGDRTYNFSRNLRWATRLENTEDKRRHGTLLRGEQIASAKITAAHAQAIMSDSRRHWEIAADYGIDRSSIGRIKSRQRWAHVHETGAAA